MTFQHISIPVPSSVTVSRRDHVLMFTGPLGRCDLNLRALDPHGMSALCLSQDIHVLTRCRAMAGVLKTLIRQRMYGVTRGYIKLLQVRGIGYRVRCEGPMVYFKLGQSHDLVYRVPSSLRLYVMESHILCLFGVDYGHVTHVASQLCRLRPSSIYHDKGIRPWTA